MASNVLAELYAIWDGLIMALNQHIKKIHIETDSYNVFQMLCRDPLMKPTHHKMVKDIRAPARDFEAVWISFCYREANRRCMD